MLYCYECMYDIVRLYVDTYCILYWTASFDGHIELLCCWNAWHGIHGWSWICFWSYHDHNNIINNFNCFMFTFVMASVPHIVWDAVIPRCIMVWTDDEFASYFLAVAWFHSLVSFFIHAFPLCVCMCFFFCCCFCLLHATSLFASHWLCVLSLFLDRISLSRNLINQFYLYKPYFQNIHSCAKIMLSFSHSCPPFLFQSLCFSFGLCVYVCALLTAPISNWTECVFYALHFVDLYETFCTMEIYIRLH